MNKLDPFEELLRSKLQSNELEFDNSLWDSIEKELPRGNSKFKTYKYIGISVLAIGVAASIMYYNSVNKTDNNNVLVDKADVPSLEIKPSQIEDEIISEEVAILNTSNTITLGKHSSASSNYFKGYIDDFRVYNMALTPNEIKGLYYNSSNYARIDFD